jgi:hypothetical protein
MARAAPGFRHRSVGEIGDQAADLPQEVLARLGGRPHPLRRRIIAPGETPIRTLVHTIGGDALDGTLTSKEIAHAVTSLPEERVSAADLAKIARGQRGTGSVHWLRHRPERGREHRLRRKRPAGRGHAAEPRHQPALYRLVIEITRTLHAIGRNRNRILSYLPL